MTRTIVLTILCLGFVPLLHSCKKNDIPWLLDSPDQMIRIEISQQPMMSSDRLYYSIYRKDAETYSQIMDLSPLGIEREDSRFIDNLKFVSMEQVMDMEDNYTLISGKKLNCKTSFNSMTLSFKNPDKQKISLIFRVYNDGIAFRYLFTGKSKKNVRVVNEYTGFDFKDGNFWAHPYDTISKWSPSYETYFSGPLDVGTEAPWNKNGWAFPILIESEGTWMLVSEAGFDGTYGASHLNADCEDGRYMITFAEQGESDGYFENTSYSSLPWYTPWRFIAIGNSLHEIVETTLPTDLSLPSKVEDTEWIKPGRASWSWWSDSDSPQDYERLVPFVDLAADMGWEYSLIDANWNQMENGNINKLVKYAENKNVGLLLWYNSGGKHNIVSEEPRNLMNKRIVRRKEFEKISNMGVKGVKVDFFQSDKQEIIKQYIDILEDAAEFNLLVNFHGCTLPKGWRRTWPNLVTMESVRGGECYKFDSKFPKIAPSHLSIIPFTRNAVGPVDYTTGGFSDNTYPHLTTYGFELALPIVLESGIMHHMDTPDRTMELPSFAVDFLKNIPVAWDDTRYIAGYPGRDVVIARKKGDRWYIGGINGENFQKDLTFEISAIDFIPDTIHLILDGPSARALNENHMVSSNGKLTIHMEPFGGFVGYWD